MTGSAEPALDPARREAELETALEQLRVAQEELLRRTAQLEAARDEIIRERERYAARFDSAPIAYVVTDLNGLVRDANEAAADLLNFVRPFVRGKPLALFAADRPRFRRRLLELRDAERMSWELVVTPRNGRSIHVAAAARAIRTSPVEAEHEIVWALADIEPRVSAEAELRLLAAELEARVEERTVELSRERALLRAVVEQMPAGLVVAEAPSGRVISVNARAAEIARGVIPSLPSEWPLAGALESGQVAVGALVDLERPDGTRARVEASASPVVDAAGRTVAAVVIFEDVTERERAERAQREFVTNAAHELLTPLAAITSAVEVLQGGAKEDPDQRDRFLAHAERETARLGRLARALLVLARVQMGSEAPKGELVEVEPLLRDIATELHLAPGVSVEVRCPKGLALVANRELAAQALSNVATNAAKFTRGGSILFRGRRAGEAHVVVDVVDTGPGISEEEAAHVFERFYRTSGGRETTDGFGLGLAVARQAVEALGGEIALSSEIGRGTTVSLKLPGGRLVRA